MKIFFLSLAFAALAFAQPPSERSISGWIRYLKLMTLDEKIGQMNQYNDDWNATGPATLDSTSKRQQLRNGQLGSLLNCVGTRRTRVWQEVAMQSRLKIPLLFGPGCDTWYKQPSRYRLPKPPAGTWKPLNFSACIAATEASSAGCTGPLPRWWDIARDPLGPRWRKEPAKTRTGGRRSLSHG